MVIGCEDIENKQTECYYLDKLETKKHCKHKRVFWQEVRPMVSKSRG